MVEAVVRNQYNRLAKIYDQRWQGYISQTLNFLYDWSALDGDEIVLDVACGTGEFERHALAHHPEQSVTGVDLSPSMLEIARQKCPTVNFTLGSATALPFGADRFDVVLSANAFHYFEPVDQALGEMVRVTRPGGRVIILDWCRDDWLCQLCDWGLKLVDPAHRQCYTQTEFHALLRQQNLQIVGHRRVRFGWWGLMVATCEVLPAKPR
ncbi:MAG: class I SAM-dependent methyltransferase [Cyanobacteria bacterium J06607_6]